jgi:Dolichyl-phosphate-mannose-protein mannosyltransferase
MHTLAATRGGVAPALRTRLGNTSREARWAALATLAFLAVSVWWLTQETRTPDFDSATHTLYSFTVYERIAHGEWSALFNEWNTYPPLGHLIGAIGVAVGGYSTFAVILALNLVFVPLLAASCYGVGRLIAGPRAGLLAVIFALGTPMIVSEAHEAYLDPTQAAFVAAAVWGILASERFERWGIAALAGLAAGLALMTKETSPVFLAGILAVVLARGGWRHWRGLLAYVVAAGVVAGPWYFNHRTLVHELFLAHSATANSVEANPFGGSYPTLFSLKNVTWYFWDAANIQLRAGLLLLFLLGTVAAIWSCVKHWGPKNLYPELLGGAFVSWAGMTWLTHKDPRYDLSALIYVAVLGTAWIVVSRPRVRPWLLGVLGVSVAASFAGVAFGLGGAGYQLRVALPGAHDTTALGARYVTLYSTSGWLRGAPDNHDGNVLALMRGLRRAGVRGVAFCCVNPVDFSIVGLQLFAIEAPITDLGTSPANLATLGPKDVFLLAHMRVPGDPPPCQTYEGIGIYAELGNPLIKPFSQYEFICPGRRPEIYGHT